MVASDRHGEMVTEKWPDKKVSEMPTLCNKLFYKVFDFECLLLFSSVVQLGGSALSALAIFIMAFGWGVGARIVRFESRCVHGTLRVWMLMAKTNLAFGSTLLEMLVSPFRAPCLDLNSSNKEAKFKFADQSTRSA